MLDRSSDEHFARVQEYLDAGIFYVKNPNSLLRSKQPLVIFPYAVVPVLMKINHLPGFRPNRGFAQKLEQQTFFRLNSTDLELNSNGVRKFQPRNYEAGSPEVGLKVGEYPTTRV